MLVPAVVSAATPREEIAAKVPAARAVLDAWQAGDAVAARVVASAVVLVVVRHQRGEKLLLNLLSHALEVAVGGVVLGTTRERRLE